jgi:hypothetical protein
MPDIVIDIIIVLIAAAVAVFLILAVVNIALVRKLRSIIPPSPHATSSAAHASAPGSKNARL